MGVENIQEKALEKKKASTHGSLLVKIVPFTPVLLCVFSCQLKERHQGNVQINEGGWRGVGIKARRACRARH